MRWFYLFLTESPTAPRPNTATVEPASTFIVLMTAPIPVVIPQPSKHTRSSFAAGFILAREISAHTVYCEKVEVPYFFPPNQAPLR